MGALEILFIIIIINLKPEHRLTLLLLAIDTRTLFNRSTAGLTPEHSLTPLLLAWHQKAV